MSGWEGSAGPVLEAYEAAVGAFVELVGRAGRAGGGWERPGLGRWDLRALVGHTSRALVTVTTYLDRPATSEVLPSAAAYLAAAARSDGDAVYARGVAAGQDLGDDPHAFVTAEAERSLERLRRADPEQLVETVGGGMRLRNYLPTRTFELVVHGCDVAAALGLEPDVPPVALAEASGLATAAVLEQGRGTDLLLTLTGRADWPADLVVVR